MDAKVKRKMADLKYQAIRKQNCLA